MFKATIVKIAKLGEPKEPYPQSWWGEVNDDLTPIMFYSNDEFQVGNDIEYESKEMKKSSKGTTYWLLKKVKKVVDNGDVDEPVANTALNPTGGNVGMTPSYNDPPVRSYDSRTQTDTTQLDRIESAIQEIHSDIRRLLEL